MIKRSTFFNFLHITTAFLLISCCRQSTDPYMHPQPQVAGDTGYTHMRTQPQVAGATGCFIRSSDKKKSNPDAICFYFLSGGCNNPRCQFAHKVNEVSIKVMSTILSKLVEENHFSLSQDQLKILVDAYVNSLNAMQDYSETPDNFLIKWRHVKRSKLTHDFVRQKLYETHQSYYSTQVDSLSRDRPSMQIPKEQVEQSLKKLREEIWHFYSDNWSVETTGKETKDDNSETEKGVATSSSEQEFTQMLPIESIHLPQRQHWFNCYDICFTQQNCSPIFKKDKSNIPIQRYAFQCQRGLLRIVWSLEKQFSFSNEKQTLTLKQIRIFFVNAEQTKKLFNLTGIQINPGLYTLDHRRLVLVQMAYGKYMLECEFLNFDNYVLERLYPNLHNRNQGKLSTQNPRQITIYPTPIQAKEIWENSGFQRPFWVNDFLLPVIY